MASATKIPIIDISATSDEEQEKVAKELVEAAIEHGFVYIRNRGADIPAASVDEAFDLCRRIFAAPVEEKQKCTIQKNNRGWSSMNYETLDPKNQRVGDFKEAFNFGDFIDGKAQQPIPASLAPYEAQISSFYNHCYALSLHLNHLLGIGLAVTPPTFFRTRHERQHGPTGNILRFLHYPPRAALSLPQPPDAADVRAGAHSDYGSLTLLFRLRGQAGLELLRDSSPATWVPVPVDPPPGADADPCPPILVNIGDLLSYWTNGLLRSTVHRVVFPEGEGKEEEEARYSIAFFCHPVGSTTLEPVPSARVAAHVPPEGFEGRGGAEKGAITADEHLGMRLRASYLELYEKEKGAAAT